MRRLHEARFVAGAASPGQFPELEYPEVAFVGRSNVGKSSLLNALIGGKPLARVSKTPGRTQQINFFVVDDRLTFVDLPGYGFAKVPPRLREHWARLVREYLEHRKQLSLVLLLVDLRRGIEEDESRVLSWVKDLRVSCAVAVTKADKASQSERARQVRALEKTLEPLDVPFILTSATRGEGIGDLWKTILEACELRRPGPDRPRFE
ncbi:MAG: putative GTP-binding protein EngB [Candidatus Binatia bacterium]|nr:MAG: putative GTP-binding protein EngB [Candidatus Binatia bacterium]